MSLPPFAVGDDAVFIRLTERAGGDSTIAAATIDMITGWRSLNELKHTRISR